MGLDRRACLLRIVVRFERLSDAVRGKVGASWCFYTADEFQRQRTFQRNGVAGKTWNMASWSTIAQIAEIDLVHFSLANNFHSLKLKTRFLYDGWDHEDKSLVYSDNWYPSSASTCAEYRT